MNVCYVDVRVLQRISRVASGIWADTISDAWPMRIVRVRAKSRAPHYYALNVCYVDDRAVWRVSRVVSGVRADTVFNERSMSIDAVCPR